MVAVTFDRRDRNASAALRRGSKWAKEVGFRAKEIL